MFRELLHYSNLLTNKLNKGDFKMTKPRLATLNVNGNLEEGLKNTVHVRDLAPFFVDEPERLGGTNAGPNPLSISSVPIQHVHRL